MPANENADSRGGLSRRTVVKAAAWSVPILAVGSNAPAMAASPVVTFKGDGCKLPGNSASLFKGYAFLISVTNQFPCEVTVTVTSLTLDGQSLGTVLFVKTDGECTPGPANTLIIPPSTTLENVVLLTQNQPNSQNGAIRASYTVTGSCIPGGSETVTGATATAPPIQGGSCTTFTAGQKDCVRSIIGVAPPTITGLSSLTGPQGSGLTITGTNFALPSEGGTVVQFGTTTATITVVSNTQIDTTVPAGVLDGATVISVTTAGGTANIGFTVT